MLKPGESVVAVTQFRDFVLVFGDQGTVLRLDYDHSTTHIYLSTEIIDLRYGS